MIHKKYQLRTLHLCCGSQFSLLQDRSGILNEFKNSHGTTNSQLDTLKDNTNRQYEDLSKVCYCTATRHVFMVVNTTEKWFNAQYA